MKLETLEVISTYLLVWQWLTVFIVVTVLSDSPLQTPAATPSDPDMLFATLQSTQPGSESVSSVYVEDNATTLSDVPTVVGGQTLFIAL